MQANGQMEVLIWLSGQMQVEITVFLLCMPEMAFTISTDTEIQVQTLPSSTLSSLKWLQFSQQFTTLPTSLILHVDFSFSPTTSTQWDHLIPFLHPKPYTIQSSSL
jgi:hypothetical protein